MDQFTEEIIFREDYRRGRLNRVLAEVYRGGYIQGRL